MIEKPRVKTRGHYQLSMLLPLRGGGSFSVPPKACDEEHFRQAALNQLEKSGLRKRVLEDD